MKTFKATVNDSGRTLWKYFLKVLQNVPPSRIERSFRQKDIKVNNIRVKDKKYVLKEGDIISIYGITFEEFPKQELIKVKKNFIKIYEDENILIVDKKSGVLVHDAPNCLDYQVLTYLKYVQKDSFKPSHIGRLDKVASGLMIYGKTYQALRELNKSQNQFKKIYEFRSDLEKSITTNFKIMHNEKLQKQVASETGKISKTIFTVKKNGKKFAELKTGRKHQIRVSLEKLKKPIHGDIKYGGKKAKRTFLHSTFLKLDGLPKEFSYLNGKEFNSNPKW